MDEMVQLYHEGKVHGPLFFIRGVRRVFFKTLEQIPLLFGVAAQIAPPPQLDGRGAVIPSAATRAYVNTMSQADLLPNEMGEVSLNTTFQVGSRMDEDLYSKENIGPEPGAIEETKKVAVQDDTEELELDPTVDAETLARSMNAARTEDVADAPSQKQADAACIIQRMYRRNLQRRFKSARSTLSEARSRFFAQCWTESEKMGWSHRHYRLLFLGPLPHLLVCLERANTYAFDSKARVKRRLTMVKHIELEDVQMMMTEAKCVSLRPRGIRDAYDCCSRILKELLQLRKTLDPKAALHKHRDLQALQALAQEAEILIRGLPCVPELQDDLDLAVKGILTKGSQKKKPKPLLYVDKDINDYMDWSM